MTQSAERRVERHVEQSPSSRSRVACCERCSPDLANSPLIAAKQREERRLAVLSSIWPGFTTGVGSVLLAHSNAARYYVT